MENQQQQDNSPPNDGSRSNNDDGRNATAGNTENSDNNVPRSNVTVRIQYQYFTPQGLADASNGTVDPAATQDGGNGSQAHVQGSNTLPLPAGVNGLPAAMPFGNAVDSPDLILSFQDVPLTSPDRLNSFITIAAELAMRRFQNMLNRPKGITNEAFKELPVIKIEELPDKTETTCSICYDKFVDEPEDTAENSKKRKHESNSNEDSMDDITGEGKIPRTGSNTPSSLMAATGISDNNNERTTISSILNPQSESDSSQSHESTHNAFIENTEGQDQAQATQEQNPEYLHSPVKIPCGHIFGRSCLYEWTRLENSCPLCRKKLPSRLKKKSKGKITKIQVIWKHLKLSVVCYIIQQVKAMPQKVRIIITQTRQMDRWVSIVMLLRMELLIRIIFHKLRKTQRKVVLIYKRVNLMTPIPQTPPQTPQTIIM